jgi:hypothetical protein
MRLTQLDAGDHVKLRKIAQQSSQSCGEGLYCQSSPRADLSEIFTVALLSTFSTVSAKSDVSRARKMKFVPNNQPSNGFKIWKQKYSACIFLKIGNDRGIPPRRKGRIANVTYARRVAVDAIVPTDERPELRTAKSCGPSAPMQGVKSERSRQASRRRRWQLLVHRGERV